MTPLTARGLLDAWEAGQRQRWPQRGLTLLAAADPGTPADAWTRISIGERDRRLLLLREWTFGPTAQATVACTQCAERLEFEIDLAAMREVAAAPPGTERMAIEGYDVAFRVPTTGDLAAIAEEADAERAHDLLLARCVVEVMDSATATAVAVLPDALRPIVIERMAAEDPLAEIGLDLQCPACRHEWRTTFDILHFFWAEVHAWAIRILRDVHVLASAYGWREADILSMTAWRRSIYLELAGG